MLPLIKLVDRRSARLDEDPPLNAATDFRILHIATIRLERVKLLRDLLDRRLPRHRLRQINLALLRPPLMPPFGQPKQLLLLLLGLELLVQPGLVGNEGKLALRHIARRPAILEVVLPLLLEENRLPRRLTQLVALLLGQGGLLLLVVERTKLDLQIVDRVHALVDHDRVLLLALIRRRRRVEAVEVAIERVGRRLERPSARAHHLAFKLVGLKALWRGGRLVLLVLVEPRRPIHLELRHLALLGEQRRPVRAGLRLLQPHSHVWPGDEPRALVGHDVGRERDV